MTFKYLDHSAMCICKVFDHREMMMKTKLWNCSSSSNLTKTERHFHYESLSILNQMPCEIPIKSTTKIIYRDTLLNPAFTNCALTNSQHLNTARLDTVDLHLRVEPLNFFKAYIICISGWDSTYQDKCILLRIQLWSDVWCPGSKLAEREHLKSWQGCCGSGTIGKTK